MVAERIPSRPVPDTTLNNKERHLPLPMRILPTDPINPFQRPLEPLAASVPPPPPPEPVPWTATADEWRIWADKRNAHEDFRDKQKKARAYASENDLRGTF